MILKLTNMKSIHVISRKLLDRSLKVTQVSKKKISAKNYVNKFLQVIDVKQSCNYAIKSKCHHSSICSLEQD